jgi:mono/diheme cytochrome c family protein
VKILLTILACAAVGVFGAVGFIYSGLYDVSALQPDNALVAWAVHTISDRSVNARLGGITVPAGLDKAEPIQAGGRLFAENCSVCHGGPGLKTTNIALGLNPVPPNLFGATRKPDSTENFRFIKYGVKMTAMPGFGPTQSDDQVWQLVAFLGAAPGMTAAAFTAQTGMSAATQMGAKAAGG